MTDIQVTGSANIVTFNPYYKGAVPVKLINCTPSLSEAADVSSSAAPSVIKGEFIIVIQTDDGVRFTGGGPGNNWETKRAQKAQIYKTRSGAERWIKKQGYGEQAEIIEREQALQEFPDVMSIEDVLEELEITQLELEGLEADGELNAVAISGNKVFATEDVVGLKAEFDFSSMSDGLNAFEVISAVFENADWESDARKSSEGRRGHFLRGWRDGADLDKTYTAQTLASLTWTNLGYRIAKKLGDRPMREREACWRYVIDAQLPNTNEGDWEEANEAPQNLADAVEECLETHDVQAGEERLPAWLVVLRWMLCLPGGVLAAWLSWLVSMLGGRLFMVPEGLLYQISVHVTGGYAMGFTFIYISALIAPVKSKSVLFGLSAIGLVVTGVLLLPAIMAVDVWAIVSNVFLGIGLSYCSYGLITSVEEGKKIFPASW